MSKADVVTDFRRSQILAAAREAFARQGLAGTTMDGIAKRAGVAKGTVYLYYTSRDEILQQILDEQAHFEMSPDVRRKALQKLETVYKAQLDAWSDAIIAAQHEGLVANTIEARACASTIVALAGGLGRQRLRGWITGPVETVAGQASAALWHGMVSR